MNWLNLELKTLRSETFLGSEPVDRATWLALLAYCAGQENGGKIEFCAGWSCRKWQQIAGVTKDEIERVSDLWSWDGECVSVWGYPVEKEGEVKARREAGRRGGVRSGEARREAPVEAELEAQLQGELERNEKEKGMEGERNENPLKAPKASRPLSGGVSEGKDSSLIPTTPQSKRVAAIFHRRPNTPWDKPDVAAYRRLGTIDPSDLDAVEAYYAAHWPPNSQTNILRHSLSTFCNNFQGEVDRARSWQQSQKPAAKEGYIEV